MASKSKEQETDAAAKRTEEVVTVEEEPQIIPPLLDAAGEINPDGLQFLLGIDYLRIKQDISIGELFSNMDFANAYQAFNITGQRLFVIGEQTNCCIRLVCKTARPFRFVVATAAGAPVFTIKRACSCVLIMCNGYCCNSVTVRHVSSGQLLGKISQRCISMQPCYDVFDGSGKFVAYVIGPCCGAVCPECMCCSASFNVHIPDRTKIGVIKKKMGNICTECCTVADTFELNFEADIDPKLKANLMGVAMAIDFTYYEGNNYCRGPFWIIFAILLIIVVVVLFVTGVFTVDMKDSKMKGGP